MLETDIFPSAYNEAPSEYPETGHSCLQEEELPDVSRKKGVHQPGRLQYY